MKRKQLLKMAWAPGLTVLILFMGAPSHAATVSYYLRADVFSIAAGTYSASPQIPDENVMMWGYSNCNIGFTTCTGPTVPGPTLTANEGDTVTITIQNNLTGANLLLNAPAGTTVPFAEKDGTLPTSLIIRGQNLPLSPTWINPAGTAVTSTGARLSGDLTSRVRSFTAETLQGASRTYTFTNARPGTYLYQSGTHPQVQVQMGLYGALIVNSATAGRAYDDASTAYNTQVTLLFSEIDQELHYSVASGLYGTPPPDPPGVGVRGQRTSTVDYHPDFFLINGNPFTFGLSPIVAGNAGGRLLVRLLNAGLMEKTPTFQNQSMTLIAEDGNLLPHSKVQYSTLLPAGKTLDAIITPSTAGYIPVYDRALNLTNAEVSPGGDRVYLQINTGGGIVPAATATLSVTKNGTGYGTITAQSAPAGINCGSICSQSYLTGTRLRLDAAPDSGSEFTGWTGAGCSGTGECILTISGNTSVTATFDLAAPVVFDRITILQPTAGETISAGSTNTISWGAPSTAVTFRVQYSINGGLTWKTIATGVTGTTQTWTLPVPPKTRPNSVVRVTGYNAKGKSIGSGRSGKFTISVP